MFNAELFQSAIDNSGLKESFIAEKKLCISYTAFYNKKTGKVPFKNIEKNVLCDVLALNDDEKEKIFG